MATARSQSSKTSVHARSSCSCASRSAPAMPCACVGGRGCARLAWARVWLHGCRLHAADASQSFAGPFLPCSPDRRCPQGPPPPPHRRAPRPPSRPRQTQTPTPSLHPRPTARPLLQAACSALPRPACWRCCGRQILQVLLKARPPSALMHATGGCAAGQLLCCVAARAAGTAPLRSAARATTTSRRSGGRAIANGNRSILQVPAAQAPRYSRCRQAQIGTNDRDVLRWPRMEGDAAVSYEQSTLRLERLERRAYGSKGNAPVVLSQVACARPSRAVPHPRTPPPPAPVPSTQLAPLPLPFRPQCLQRRGRKITLKARR